MGDRNRYYSLEELDILPLSTNPKFIDRTGESFSGNTALGWLGRSNWAWKCRCGFFFRAAYSKVRDGKKHSCGCVKPVNYNYVDITDKTFNKLTPKYIDHKNKRGEEYWFCECSCGGENVILKSHITTGKTTSCGCNRKGINKTHGESKSPTWMAWVALKRRCSNIDSNSLDWKNYGSRGINHEFDKYEDFLAEVGHKPQPHKLYSLDRINNDLGYVKGNIRWATRSEQNYNRRNTIFLTHNGITAALEYWSKETGLSTQTLMDRKHKGWDDSRIITQSYRNVRKTNGKILLTYQGIERPIKFWAEQTGISARNIRKRIYHNWPVERALTEPVYPGKNQYVNG